MNEQSAKFTATLCDDVYELTRKSTLDLANEFLTQKYKGLLKFSENNMLAGKTGGPAFIKVKTGFGFTLIGDNQLSGHQPVEKKCTMALIRHSSLRYLTLPLS